MPYDDDSMAGAVSGPTEAKPAGAAMLQDQDRGDAPVREREPERRESRPARETQPGRDAPHDGGTGGGAPGQGARRRPRWLRPALVVAAIILIGLTLWYYESTKNLVSTDDAYTDGNAVLIAPRVSGQVVELAINDNQFVHQGQLLIRIDPRPFVNARDEAQGTLNEAEGRVAAAQQALEVARKDFPARLASAEAQRDVAEAALFRTNQDLDRQRRLPRQATTQQDLDNAIAAQRTAQAQVEQAEAAIQEALPVQPNIAQAEAEVKQLQGTVLQAQAELAQAELNLSWTAVTAPQDGWVTRRDVNEGNYVQAGASILSLVTTDVWVTANFKETQLDRMRPGQPVTISVDAYPGLALQGHVDSIQLGSGSKFSAFPAENATGNFVKIVQRVPVKIVIEKGLDPKRPLPLGISVEPSVNVAQP